MPKARVSSVWQHYDVNQERESFAVCRYCGNNISRGGMSSNLKGNNTTNLWTHLRHKHSDEVLINPVPPRKRPNKLKVSDNTRNVNISKAKIIRQPVRVAKPKLEAAQANESGALPPNWEQYEHSEEISDDIKDIIYSEDPLCYSPIHIADDMEDCEEKVNLLNASRAASSTTAMSSNLVISTAVPSAAKARATNLEASLDRLSSVSEQMSFMIQTIQDDQNKDDDYYFALSLVPIMRQLSLNRKLYVRSKIQEILFKETEVIQPKSE